ncbi:MAG: aromatic amino acid transport family protein [bacterium]|nr:aromatic amino acid transport family protein [bacterium]
MLKIIYAIATLSGTIIGVGLFSLPFITRQVGVLTMLGYFFILGFLVILIHLLFSEVALATPDRMRFPGYAKLHLGSWGQKLALISSLTGFFGALLAYLIVGGEFLTNLLGPLFGGNNVFYTALYFLIGSLMILFGIKIISRIEFWGLIGFIVVLALMFFRGRGLIDPGNLTDSMEIKNWFLPYGPIFFSLWGASLIPELEEMLAEKKHLLKKVVFVSILIPIIVYLFFIYLVLGITGAQTTESAMAGLKNVLGNGMVNLGLLFGLITTFTSFIAIGLALKNTLHYDLKLGKNLAFGVACFLPLILFLAGLKSFIGVISFVGGVMLGIDGILILLMYRKLHPRKLWVPPLVLVFLGGIIYEIIYFTR